MMLSPRRRLEAFFAPHREAAERAAKARVPGHYTMPICTRHHVRIKVDPRHLGKVEKAFGTQVTVRWLKTGWLSDHNATELEIAS